MNLPPELLNEEENTSEETSENDSLQDYLTTPDTEISDLIEFSETPSDLDLSDFEGIFSMCDEGSSEDNSLESLINSVLQCEVCQEMFLDRYMLYRHNLTHLDLRLQRVDGMNQCDYCEQYFVDRNSLEKHIIKNHFNRILG